MNIDPMDFFINGLIGISMLIIICSFYMICKIKVPISEKR